MGCIKCCSCHLESDYGTSVVYGTGSAADPYLVNVVDPDYLRPLVRVSGGAIAPVLNDTPTAIPFTTEEIDTAGFWVIGTPTRLTIPQAGMYLMGAENTWGANTTGVRELQFRLNGTTVLDHTQHLTTSVGELHVTSTYLWPFIVGDYIEIMVRQTTGISFNMSNGIAWMAYMGRKV